jgi:hypothetical protein
VFDRYMIVEDSLRPTDEGFAFDIRITYYRGVALSLIEGFEVTVDGRPVPRDAIRFVLRGVAYTQAELDHDTDGRWEFGEIATLAVEWPGGLSSGVHTIEAAQQLRISYLPGPLRGQDTKTLLLAG